MTRSELLDRLAVLLGRRVAEELVFDEISTYGMRDRTHQRVKKILSEKREVLDRLAHLLSEKESVEGDQPRRMLSASGHQMVN
jgi:ATP-dependent Zn protease